MIVRTKLHIPHSRHAIVSRPRLMRVLDERSDAKLTLLSAQAGYGKTTLLSEWVKHSRSSVAWVSLDQLDNDWLSFWRYVAAAIRQCSPEFGVSSLPLLDQGSSVPTGQILKAMLHDMELLPEDVSIILDDYHCIELPSIHESLSYLLERLPPRVRLIIASRTVPDIPVARLLVEGELNRIDMHDLKFRLDEGLAFFHDTTGLKLTSEQADWLIQRTEGWISGMQLAAISLQRSSNVTDSIKQIDGLQHRIFDYLMEEVYRRLPEPLRNFLLDTSVLRRMNRSLCQAVTGQRNSQKQLEQLERLNLFIVPLDEQRNWYRYHHLLSQFLLQLASEASAEKLATSHIRAAEWFEKQGDEEEAVEHYLEGRRPENAVRIIERNLPAFLQSKNATLTRWMAALPEHVLEGFPVMELFSLSVLVVSGQWRAALERVERGKVRFAALQGKLPEEDWLKAMGNLHFFGGVAFFLNKDLKRASDDFELADRFMPEGSAFQMSGRNRYHGSDAFTDLLSVIGDLREAEPFFLRWIGAWQHKKQFPFSGYMYVAYCDLLYEWNRLDEAETFIGHALGREDLQPFARMMVHIGLTASRIQRAKGNGRQAEEHLLALEAKIDSPDYESFLHKIQAEQACLQLQLGVPRYARSWLNESDHFRSEAVSLDRLAEHLIAARALSSCDRHEEALQLLDRIQRMLPREDRLRDRIKLGIMRGVTHWRSGQTKVALQALEHALQLAEPQGYIRSFIDEGAPMVDMLTELEKAGSDASSVSMVYIRHLLEAMAKPLVMELPRKMILTEQEKKVLSLVAEGLLNKEIAHRLSINVETVKFHVKNSLRKLEARNRVQAVQRAQKLKILG